MPLKKWAQYGRTVLRGIFMKINASLASTSCLCWTSLGIIKSSQVKFFITRPTEGAHLFPLAAEAGWGKWLPSANTSLCENLSLKAGECKDCRTPNPTSGCYWGRSLILFQFRLVSAGHGSRRESGTECAVRRLGCLLHSPCLPLAGRMEALR